MFVGGKKFSVFFFLNKDTYYLILYFSVIYCSVNFSGANTKVYLNYIPNKYKLFHEEFPKFGGFPGGAVVKNPPANAGDTGSSPGPGRSHMPRSN